MGVWIHLHVPIHECRSCHSDPVKNDAWALTCIPENGNLPGTLVYSTTTRTWDARDLRVGDMHAETTKDRSHSSFNGSRALATVKYVTKANT